MAQQPLLRLLAELEALPQADKRRALVELNAIVHEHRHLLPQTADSASPRLERCGSCSTRSIGRVVAALGLATAILSLSPVTVNSGSLIKRRCPEPIVRVTSPAPIKSIEALEHVVSLDSAAALGMKGDIVRCGNSGSLTSGARRHRASYPPHPAFDEPREAIARLKPDRNTSSFPLIVCIGHGKTATKSLNKALVMLGMNTAHFYGAGVYSLLFDNAAEQADKQFLFNVNEEKHVAAVLDTPVVDFYNEIALAYPNAKFILTVRNPRTWIRSQQKFYRYYARGCRNWLAPWRRGSNIVYGTECPSSVQALKRYHQHNRNVFDAIPNDRLLIMDIPGGDGWDKLCPFLGIPIPDNSYGNMTFPNRH